MEHEVFVPLSVAGVRQALADPKRIARAVPGLQHDAGTEPLAGRLKLRIGSTTVTYRGALRVTDSAAEGFTEGESHVVTGEAAEARGSGTVKFTLTLRLTPAEDGGTRLTFTGTGSADGRTAELPSTTVESALHRTLTRFAENLARGAGEGGTEDGGTEGEATSGEKGSSTEDGGTSSVKGSGTDGRTADRADRADRTDSGTRVDSDSTDRTEAPHSADPTGSDEPTDTGPTTPAAPAAPAGDTAAAEGFAASADAAETAEPSDPAEPAAPDDEAPLPPGSSVFGTDVPPSSLDPYADEDQAQDAADAAAAVPGDEAVPGEGPAPAEGAAPGEAAAHEGETMPPGSAEPPAEAAHARRTMIGRSAEEVDHAPPRGRYAPVPPPDAFSGTATLRWAAPAAALVVASAIVVGRALRRRH
ncbi:SRPBCC family protein [Streptomyces sp. NA04227]|uniref:CoxG family protein n=1 Tax=Streptomyces sp. NA04227 TaxID=2742136 RepID=UPI0015929875|nr:SRPBCC family protein [Streptomyces sp. NA04227]QKW07462.1 SRPBCC family protein [Streptomyces sp. NA04227]